LIALAAVVVAWFVFRFQQAESAPGEVRAATATLRGLQENFFAGIGHLYFSTVPAFFAPGVAAGGVPALNATVQNPLGWLTIRPARSSANAVTRFQRNRPRRYH